MNFEYKNFCKIFHFFSPENVATKNNLAYHCSSPPFLHQRNSWRFLKRFFSLISDLKNFSIWKTLKSQWGSSLKKFFTIATQSGAKDFLLLPRGNISFVPFVLKTLNWHKNFLFARQRGKINAKSVKNRMECIKMKHWTSGSTYSCLKEE